MKKFFSRFLAFAFIAALPLLAINHFFSLKVRTSDFGKPLWTMNRQNQSYDYIVAGSSRAENIINVRLINETTRLKGINIAHSGSAFLENYLTLVEFLNKNNTSVVVLSTDIYGLIEPKKAYNKPFHEYYFIPYLYNDTIYDGVAEHIGKLKAFVWRHFPLYGYLEYNNIYSLNQVLFPAKNDPAILNNFGYQPVSESEKINFAGIKNEKSYYIIDSDSKRNLEKIIALCAQKKTKLIFYCAPIYQKTYKNMIGATEGHMIIDSLAKKNNIPFLNFADCMLSHDTTFFKDHTHLNQKGANEFSKIIGDSINALLIKSQK